MSEQIQIEEVRRVVRVNYKGKKTKKLKCRRGFKLQGSSCVPITGAEKSTKRKAIRQALRTKRAAGAGAKKRTTKRRLKARNKRKGYGLK